MSSTFGRYGLRGIRLVLVVAGAGCGVVAIRALVTIPPAPPGSDGFVTGGAYLLWGALSVLSLGVAGFGVALPTFLGADDALGFNRHQRGLLKVAGWTLTGGLLAGGVGLAANSFFGMLLSLVVVLLGVLGVCSALAWRLVEVVQRRLRRAVDDAS